MAVDVGDLRVQLALAETALMFGQTPEMREKAMLDIARIKAELERIQAANA